MFVNITTNFFAIIMVIKIENEKKIKMMIEQRKLNKLYANK